MIDFSLSSERLDQYLTERHGAPVEIEALQQLGGDSEGAAALKQFGYGRPLLVTFHASGERRQLVFHAIRRNAFGRERSDDRVAAVWLDYQTFNRLPRHVRAVDTIGYTTGHSLRSLGDVEEMLLVTVYRPGTLYADDFIRIRDDGEVREEDGARVEALAGYLADIHAVSHDDPMLWRRRLRDLVGHGEGIMGLTDSYPLPLPYVTAADLQAIEEAANRWRWRLKPYHHRLCQVHGDFHPFNIVFTGKTNFAVLDRSRGEWGAAADDISCLAINFLFFSLQRSGRLEPPFQALHQRFWEQYLAKRSDEELVTVIQPWFAWRALVLASPIWYPDLDPAVRRRLLTFAERVLESERYDWQDVNRYWDG